MGIIINNTVDDIAGMLDINIVANGCGKRKGIIRNPEGRLNSGVVSNFSVGTDSHRVDVSIYNCSEANIGLLSNEDIAKNCGIGCDECRGRDCESFVINIENVPMAIDGFKVSYIFGHNRSSFIEIESIFSEHPA